MRERRYHATLNGREVPIVTPEDRLSFLEALTATPEIEVFVEERRGEMAGFERFVYAMLGLSTRDDIPCFTLLKAGGRSRLTFLNAAWSESRALDSDQSSDPGSVRFQLSNGKEEVAPGAECLRSDKALEAIRHFLELGRKPSWLTYKSIP